MADPHGVEETLDATFTGVWIICVRVVAVGADIVGGALMAVDSQDVLLREQHLPQSVDEIVDRGRSEPDPHHDLAALRVGAGEQKGRVERVGTGAGEAYIDHLRLTDHAAGSRWSRVAKIRYRRRCLDGGGVRRGRRVLLMGGHLACRAVPAGMGSRLSLIHISEPTRR